MRIPASKSDQAAAEQIKKPSVKVPEESLRKPTKIGDMNIPMPDTVIRDPHTIATFPGTIPASCIVHESKVGT